MFDETGWRARVTGDRGARCGDQTFDSICRRALGFGISTDIRLAPNDDVGRGDEREHADVQ